MNTQSELGRGPVSLKELLDGLADAPAIEVAGIAADSRRVGRGDVFFALRGSASHGLDYLRDVVEAGAAAIVWDPETGQPGLATDLPMIPLEGLDGRLGEIANRWFDNPSAAMRVAAVTGTNGKTTVAWLLAHCLRALDRKCAYIGTLGASLAALQKTGGLTTPPCLELHALLAAFRDQGAKSVALEVSSHALSQDRISGVSFDAGLFTNLSRDHIDYHGDMRSYGETKARLFLEHDLEHRVICTDSGFGRALAGRCPGNVVTVATTPPGSADDSRGVRITGIRPAGQGSLVSFESTWGDGEFRLQLPGNYNVANAALVLAMLLCWDIELADACSALDHVAGPPGRMQRVEPPARPAVYVDFAHTPDGLGAALSALRPHCEGKLWCVFGCGGDRDRGKRPQMGSAAARFADVPIVTSDNPRGEDPAAIIDDILQGMPGDTEVIEDRAAAIGHAIARAADDDLVLVAGRGHEDYQVVGDHRLVFSDYQVASKSLAARQGERR